MGRMMATMVVTYAVLIFMFSAMALVVATGDGYDCKKAENWIWRARATNDLTDMAKYASLALQEMSGLSGNPAWFFPAPDTDFDLIKDNIREVIANCEAMTATIDTMAYQQAVNNLQETLVEIADHISLAKGWLYKSIPLVVLVILMLVVWFPIIILTDDYR